MSIHRHASMTPVRGLSSTSGRQGARQAGQGVADRGQKHPDLEQEGQDAGDVAVANGQGGGDPHDPGREDEEPRKAEGEEYRPGREVSGRGGGDQCAAAGTANDGSDAMIAAMGKVRRGHGVYRMKFMLVISEAVPMVIAA